MIFLWILVESEGGFVGAIVFQCNLWQHKRLIFPGLMGVIFFLLSPCCFLRTYSTLVQIGHPPKKTGALYTSMYLRN